MALEFGIGEWLFATYMLTVLVVTAAVFAVAAIVAGMSIGSLLADFADSFIDRRDED